MRALRAQIRALSGARLPAGLRVEGSTSPPNARSDTRARGRVSWWLRFVDCAAPPSDALATLGSDVRGHVDDSSLPPPRGQGTGKRPRSQRDDRKRPRTAGLRGPRAGERLPRRRRPWPRSIPARRDARGVRHDQAHDRGRPADLRARRLRRGRHLRDRAGRLRAARPRSRGGLASAEPLRGGLRRRGRDARPARRRGLRASAHRGLRDHRRRRGRSGEGARARGRRHRPSPSRRDASGLPGCRAAPVRLSVPGALRDGRRVEAAPGAGRPRPRAAARPGRARDRRRRRAARGREPLPGHDRPAPARPHDEPRPARAHADGARRSRHGRGERARVPPRAAHQRRRPARPSARGARAAPHRRRGGGGAARGRAGDAEPRPAGRRGPHRARRARPGRRLARARAAPPRLRAGRRGLAPRRDRHRRLAARRALRPPGRPARARGGRAGSAPAARSPPSTCTGRSAPAPST